MSDFDKEAEREKLREKFAKDEQKRERTSRMSELLLKGATMTNKHHDCGSPIFRWQGEEFCPTCQGTPDGEGVAEVEGSVEGGQSEATGEVADVAVETPAENADQPSPETANGTPEAADQPPARTPDTAPDQSAGAPTPAPAPTRAPATTSAAETGRDTDLGEARASLTRTLTSLAQQAEATSDLSKQRDLLEAVEDAAEALEATKRADR